MATNLGKSCSFGLPRVPFVNCCQFMYLVISLLVLRAGNGIWLYQFLIVAYLFTLVCSNQILGNFRPVYGGLYINIETIIYWAGADNPTKSEDFDQTVHPCGLIRIVLFTGAPLGFMPTRSVCVVVQLSNRRKVRVEVQRNTDGDTPSICVAAHADLKICGGGACYSIGFTGLLLNLLRRYMAFTTI